MDQAPPEETPDAEAKRLREIDAILDDTLREPPSPISAAELLDQSRR